KFSDNAAYWRGECLMAQGQHQPAIGAFDSLIKRHPRSPKVPFALVRKAESLLALKQKPAAVAALKQVAERYANSEAAQTAKNLLAREASP
ncbi:MAG: tetratricopeptide repeat protein, partial [Myxococcota bacterium]